MFELINSIAVDRKNSLPVADLHARYRKTGTPVVFGDLCQRWPASNRWTPDYFGENVGDVNVPLYSNVREINHGLPFKSIATVDLKDFLYDVLPENNDFRVSKLAIELLQKLKGDFVYPRLGLDFNANRTMLSIGGKDAEEPMQVRDINFDQPQFEKYPALKKIFGYVADLEHGDSLYVPAGFWFSVVHHGVSIRLSFETQKASFTRSFANTGMAVINRLIDTSALSEKRLTALEREVITRTNALLKKSHKK